MPGYVLSREAETDLQEIVEYTATRYGVEKAVGYVRKLEKCAGQLAMAYGIYKQIKEVHPQLFVKHCQHHYIFGLLRHPDPMLVIALLHENMDIINRASKRLAQ